MKITFKEAENEGANIWYTGNIVESEGGDKCILVRPADGQGWLALSLIKDAAVRVIIDENEPFHQYIGTVTWSNE